METYTENDITYTAITKAMTEAEAIKTINRYCKTKHGAIFRMFESGIDRGFFKIFYTARP